MPYHPNNTRSSDHGRGAILVDMAGIEVESFRLQSFSCVFAGFTPALRTSYILALRNEYGQREGLRSAASLNTVIFSFIVDLRR